MTKLKELLADFDFATPGDHSRALAALIAPALRFGGWIKSGLPVDIGEADASQSGKTYRQKVGAVLYREVPNVVVQRSGGVGGLDEGLSQKLIDGRPFVLLDNVRGRLDSPFLEAILTAPGTVPARVPHRGEVEVDPKGFVFQLTSNGVETTRDLANRASIIRIRKRPGGYPFRQYAEGDLYAHVTANQPFYLGCVFAIIRGWAAAGCPRTQDCRHDFREWAQALDWIVQNLFRAAPLLDGQESARERVSDPRRTWLRNLCLALRESRQSGAMFATPIAEFCIEYGILPPSINANAPVEVVARRIGIVMRSMFGTSDEVDADGYKVFRRMRYSEAARKDHPIYHFGEIQTELPLDTKTEPSGPVGATGGGPGDDNAANAANAPY